MTRSGRPRNTTPIEDRIILRKFKENILITPKAVSIELEEHHKISVSRNMTERMRFSYLRSSPNTIKYLNKPQSFWEQVLWTDESSLPRI